MPNARKGPNGICPFDLSKYFLKNNTAIKPELLAINIIYGRPTHPHHAPPTAKSLASPRPMASLFLMTL